LELLASLAFFLALIVIGLTYNKSNAWVGHALAGIASLLLLIFAVSAGAMLARRIQLASRDVFSMHKKAGIYFTSFVFGSFFYALWVELSNNEPIMRSVHGRLGLAILIASALQVIPSLASKDRTRLKAAHKILGYSLAPMIFLEAVWGLYNGVVGEPKNLVLAHSASGGFAALALTWILVEVLYPTKRGLYRARIASYVSSVLIIAGCWIVGGYNYLTSYGSHVKPIIMAGPTPWAHEVAMEGKEHIFIFLPVIAVAISLILRFPDRDDLIDSMSRRALTIMTTLALSLVLMMFILGAIISNAGSRGSLT